MQKTPRIPRFLIVFLLLAALFSGARLYYALTDDFHIGGITEPIAYRAAWTSLGSDLTIQEELFSQPYTYLGKGAQSYAFVSEDGKYVIKFFKFKHLRPRWWMRCLPSWGRLASLKGCDAARKKQKSDHLFTGYMLAAEEHPDHAQILYLHLDRTEIFHRHLLVRDKMGWARRIDLDTTPFLVQKRGETLRQVIRDKLERGAIDEAKASFKAILAMYLQEYLSGMYDRDHGVMHNTGFVDGKPFHLDLGKFCRMERMREREAYGDDLSFVIWKIDVWLGQNFPEWREELSASMADYFFVQTGLSLDLATIEPTRFQRKKRWF